MLFNYFIKDKTVVSCRYKNLFIRILRTLFLEIDFYYSKNVAKDCKKDNKKFRKIYINLQRIKILYTYVSKKE